MTKKALRIIFMAMALLVLIGGLYFGLSLPHGWVFGTICSGMTEPSELFMVIDSNYKGAEVVAEEYARLNSKCAQIKEVRWVKDVGRTPWRRFGVEPIDKIDGILPRNEAAVGPGTSSPRP